MFRMNGPVAIHPSELGIRKILLEPGTNTPALGLKKRCPPPGGLPGARGTLVIFLAVNR